MMPLGCIPDWFVNSMYGLDEGASFHYQQAQEIINHHPQLHDNRSVNPGASSSTNCRIPRSVDYHNVLASELEKQRLEMDWLLQVENQRLTMVVQEKWRQHAVLLFHKYESKIMDLISQRDKDLELARIRNMELQNFLARAQEENQALQKKAMETEAMVLDLNGKLEEVREGNFIATFNEAHDVESFCESSNRAACGEEAQQYSKKMVCEQCKERSLNVVFLPCKHLCSCTTCEPLLALCPMCQSVKGGSLEVLFD